MIDIDFAPSVFLVEILIVLILPALYGYLLVDKYWQKHKAEDSADVDAFN